MAKKLINITVTAKKADLKAVKGDLLALGVFSDGSDGALEKVVDKALKGAVSTIKSLGDFTAKTLQTQMLYADGQLNTSRVMLIGLGKRDEFKLETLRKAASLAARTAVNLKAQTLLVALQDNLPTADDYDMTAIGQVLAEGINFGGYQWDEYLTSSQNGRLASLKAIVIDPDQKAIIPLQKGITTGNITGQAQNYARTLANQPGNVINPATLVNEAKKLARTTPGLKCTVLTEKQLKEKKMGGILAVGQGSATPPAMIVLEYSPAKAAAKTPAIGLVGKAITFDAGGISLKPGAGMHDMKFDKSGGMAVLGAMKAIAGLKPKTKVYGVIPAAENMPSGTSYRPGDIITTYSGKTVEIQNTDAEGRMILCDAITYAEKQLGCKKIIDTATLTGACVVSIGTKRAGIMSNDPEMIEALKTASKNTGERVWHLPCDEEYIDDMKSKIADLKNSGGKWGGACTAAAFLSQFVDKAKWAHVDIAGPGVWGADDKDAPGSVAFGVRLLTNCVCECL